MTVIDDWLHSLRHYMRNTHAMVVLITHHAVVARELLSTVSETRNHLQHYPNLYICTTPHTIIINKLH